MHNGVFISTSTGTEDIVFTNMESCLPIRSDSSNQYLEMAPVKEFGPKTTAHEVAAHFKNQIVEKTVLITGVAEGGLGAESAFSLAASQPAVLILSARSTARAQPVADKITSAHPSISVKILPMDLGSLASIRAAVKEFESWNVVLDVLINNAAVMAAPYSTTVDGFETQFGVGHLGHFLFTTLLLNDRKIKNGGRIVNVSSDGHRFGPIRFEDIGFQNGATYNEWQAYGQTKTANMLYSLSLAEKLKPRNITSLSLHPGVIQTNLGRHLNDDLLANLVEQDKQNNMPGFEPKSTQEGSSTTLIAAFDPELVSSTGAYLNHCQVDQPLKAYAADPVAAEKLFKLSEELVGEKLVL